MKKLLTLCLSLLLIASMAISGTIAFLTDSEEKVNVFTVGNVDITLEEEFEQGVELIPGVKVQKEAFIKNESETNDAWVWLTYAVPAEFKDFIHIDVETNPDLWIAKDFQTYTDAEGKEFYIGTLLHKEAIAPGVKTSAAIKEVYLDAGIDRDPARDGEYCFVENGVVTPIDGLSDIKVIVNAYAIQKDEFADVNAAYDAYGVQWGNSFNALGSSNANEGNAPQPGDPSLPGDGNADPNAGDGTGIDPENP